MATNGYPMGDGPGWLHVPASAACPPWCALPPGHEYEDAQLGDGLMREHETIAGQIGRLWVELAQYETSAGPEGPVELLPADVLLRTRHDAVELSEVTPDELRALARVLLHLADHLPEAGAVSA